MKNDKKRQHIIEIYLDYVGIQHTRMHLKELLSNSVDSDTFAGIKNILLNYKINSKGLRLSRVDLNEISDPIITQIEIDNNNIEFIVIIESSIHQCSYLTEFGNIKTIDSDLFEKKWTRVVLFPEVTEDSEEENYYQNAIIEFATNIKSKLVSLFLILISVWFFIQQGNTPLSNIPFFFLYMGGFVICILLMAQSLGIHNQLAKKICEVNKKTSCNNVLNSNGAKLFNLVGWSEIGIVYFSGSLLALIFIPSSLPLLFWINIFSLPYTLWSLIYQRYVVKRWCVLCLIVQLIFWLLFITFIYNKIDLYILNISTRSFINFIICFIIPSLGLWFIIPLLDKANRFTLLQYNYNKIKAKKAVFNTLLNEQKTLELEPLARSLSIGNKDASLTITVVSNPYCGHCATIHKRLISLLEKYPTDFKTEFIFVGDDFMEGTIKFLIAAYFQYGETGVKKIYNEWFEKKEQILQSYAISATNENIHTIYLTQRKWLENKKRVGTPAIYLNGYELPEDYTIEDLYYFI